MKSELISARVGGGELERPRMMARPMICYFDCRPVSLQTARLSPLRRRARLSGASRGFVLRRFALRCVSLRPHEGAQAARWLGIH